MRKTIYFSLLAAVTLSACAVKQQEDSTHPMGQQHHHDMGQEHQHPMHGNQFMHGEDPSMNHHAGHGEMPMHQGPESHDHMNHSMGAGKPQPAINGLPTEPGQGAFATIDEIVRILEADPATDWSKVDIHRLREHLVDMSNLSLYAQATQSRSENSITFTVKGSGNILRAIQNMVPVHTMVVSQARGWDAQTSPIENGMLLTISSNDSGLLDKLEALGFFGFMSLENHHQSHHLQMATGNDHIHH